jgi:hypothetical protein
MMMTGHKLIVIPALVLAAAAGLAGCGSARAPAPRPTVTRTVTAPAPKPSPSTTTAPPKPAPAIPAQPASGLNTSGLTNCGGGVYAGANTSCPFALNVAADYTGPGDDYANSPVTGLSYTMSCLPSANAGGWVNCTGGINASVWFYSAAAPSNPLPDPAPSPNWSGYESTGGTYTSVSASWTQPTVTCSGSTATQSAAFWVGLDGAAGSQTLEQIGTGADCNDGTADYYGWFEMLPAQPSQITFSNTVAPGDAMSASVVTNGDGVFTLTLSDSTQGWTRTTQQTSANAQPSSAEVIAEAPTITATNTEFPLANFGTVNFTGADITGQPLDRASTTGLALVSGGTTEAAPSTITNGDSFSVSTP